MKLTKVESEAMIKTANADYDVSKTKADGAFKIAKEKCDSLSGDSKNTCQSTADATLKADLSAAASVRDKAVQAASVLN